MKAWYGSLVEGEVERYEVPSLNALNFVMCRALGGGVTRSLALGPHGKTHGAWLLDMSVEI